MTLLHAVFPTLLACGRIGFEPEPASVMHSSSFEDAGRPGDVIGAHDASGTLDAGRARDASTSIDAGRAELDAGDQPLDADAAVTPQADASSPGAPDGGGLSGPLDDAGAATPAPTWRSVALPYASGAAASAVLADGLHYLGGSSHYFADVRYQHHYVYSAATGNWSAAPADVPDTDTWGARAHVHGGKLYLLGGYPGGNRLRVYDSATNAWTTLKAPPVDFQWGFASGVIGGALYAFGGEPLSATDAPGYKYTFATNAWTAVAPIPKNRGRGALSSAVVGTRLYVLNGNVNDGTSALQIYDSGTNTWSLGTSLPGHVFEAAAAVAVGSEVYFFAGAADQDIADSSSAAATLSRRVNIYHTLTDSWTTGPRMKVALMWATSAVYDGEFHVLGGLDASSSQMNVHEVLGP